MPLSPGPCVYQSGRRPTQKRLIIGSHDRGGAGLEGDATCWLHLCLTAQSPPAALTPASELKKLRGHTAQHRSRPRRPPRMRRHPTKQQVLVAASGLPNRRRHRSTDHIPFGRAGSPQMVHTPNLSLHLIDRLSWLIPQLTKDTSLFNDRCQRQRWTTSGAIHNFGRSH